MKITDLIKLGEKALTLFDEYISEKSIKPPMRVYIRHFLTELEVSETSCRSQSSSEIIQKPDWSRIVFDFMEEKIKSMDEFKQLTQSIAKRNKNNINRLTEDCNEASQSAFWLEIFIRKLIYEKLEGELSEDLLTEYASLFKSEIESSPIEYRHVHHLDGIFLETDSIKINDSVRIRKTQKSDLEYTKNFPLDIIPRPQPMDIPSSILEIEILAKDERDCHKYVKRIFDSLRLYSLGSIYSQWSSSTKRTMIWPSSHTVGGDRNYSTFRKYTVKESEVDTFVNAINAIEQKLNFDKEEKKFRSLQISIDRYNSALLESIDIDRKLMTAVMGLESLFTLKKDKGENAFKLGIRVAKLLGHLKFDAVKVRALTGKAYTFRNKVVHGSDISQKDRKEMNEIFPQILDYLRISLVNFLLDQEIGKNEMVELIDKSIISDTQNEELKKLLEKKIEEFGEILACSTLAI